MQLRGTAIVVDTVAAKMPIVSGTAVISGSGTTVTLNDLQSGSIIRLDRNTGCTFVLPDAKPGSRYEFVVSQALTSGSYIITGTAATQSYALVGTMAVTLDNLGQATTFVSSTGGYLLNQRIQLNSGTTGGLVGSRVTVTSLSSNTWYVSGLVIGTGTAFANPFTI